MPNTIALSRRLYRNTLREVASHPWQLFAFVVLMLQGLRLASAQQVFLEPARVDLQFGLPLSQINVPEPYSVNLPTAVSFTEPANTQEFLQQDMEGFFDTDNASRFFPLYKKHPELVIDFSAFFRDMVREKKLSILRGFAEREIYREVIEDEISQLTYDGEEEILETLQKENFIIPSEFLFLNIKKLYTLHAESPQNQTEIEKFSYAFTLLIKYGADYNATYRHSHNSVLGWLIDYSMLTDNLVPLKALLEANYDMEKHFNDMFAIRRAFRGMHYDISELIFTKIDFQKFPSTHSHVSLFNWDALMHNLGTAGPEFSDRIQKASWMPQIKSFLRLDPFSDSLFWFFLNLQAKTVLSWKYSLRKFVLSLDKDLLHGFREVTKDRKQVARNIAAGVALVVILGALQYSIIKYYNKKDVAPAQKKNIKTPKVYYAHHAPSAKKTVSLWVRISKLSLSITKKISQYAQKKKNPDNLTQAIALYQENQPQQKLPRELKKGSSFKPKKKAAPLKAVPMTTSTAMIHQVIKPEATPISHQTKSHTQSVHWPQPAPVEEWEQLPEELLKPIEEPKPQVIALPVIDTRPQREILEASGLKPVDEIKLTPEAEEILNLLIHSKKAKSHLTFIVGGSVRDALLSTLTDKTDVDVVTAISPKDLRSILMNVPATILDSSKLFKLQIGKRKIDIRYSEALASEQHQNILQALLADYNERDFTINGLYGILGGLLFDPSGLSYKAVKDNEKIESILEADVAFQQFPLRILRAVNYSNQLSRPLSDAILSAIVQHKQNLKDRLTDSVSLINLNSQITKLFVSPHNAANFQDLTQLGITTILFGAAVQNYLYKTPESYSHAFNLVMLFSQAQFNLNQLLIYFLVITRPIPDVEYLKSTLGKTPDSKDKLTQIVDYLVQLENKVTELASHSCIAKCVGSAFLRTFQETLRDFDNTDYLLTEKKRLSEQVFPRLNLPVLEVEGDNEVTAFTSSVSHYRPHF